MAPMKRSQPNEHQAPATKRRRTRTSPPKAGKNDVVADEETHTAGEDRDVAPSQLPVWASTRQSLCDALPYFKAHQGGVYTKDRFPQGILFARNGEMGDTVTMGKCIYSLGGGREMKEDGTWSRAGAYEPNHFEQWKVTKDMKLPVMVVLDCRHPDLKDNIDFSSIAGESGPSVVYIVLGVFFITEMWQEAVQTEDGNEYPVFKVMLQKIDPYSQPGYWKGPTPNHNINHTQEAFTQYTCGKCGKNSPAAFKNQTPTCLNRDCTEFFTANGVQLKRQQLKYDEGFLNWIKPFTGDHATIPDTAPPPPGKGIGGYGTELRCRTGMVCPNCHHCDSRVFFSYWKCGSCGLIHMAEPDPYPMAEIEKETQQYTKKLLNSKTSTFFKQDGTTIFMATPDESKTSRNSTTKKTNPKRKGGLGEGGDPDVKAQSKGPDAKGFVTKSSTKDERSTRTTYMIFDAKSNCIGSLVHERPSTALKEALCGAHELWDKIQEPGVTMDFKRNAARCSGSTIETLTRHFTQNFGAHYDYGVKVDDTSFEAAPDVVLKSLVHLSHMGKQAVESTQKIFQEEGCEAVLDSTIMDPWKQPNELLALAYMEKDTISYHDDGEKQLTGVVSTLSLGSPASMKVRFKSTKADKGKGLKGTQAYLILDVQLQHGDVVTMCDTRLQAFTEHTIVPVGIRRFAMTSRVINEDYYLDDKAAKKLQKLKITLGQIKQSAQIPGRAAAFIFEGTKLEIAEST